jgi:hypothetical protein
MSERRRYDGSSWRKSLDIKKDNWKGREDGLKREGRDLEEDDLSVCNIVSGARASIEAVAMDSMGVDEKV